MIDKKLADKLTGIAVKQLETGLKFKQPRMDEIKKFEDQYLNKTKPALKGRYNIPIPVMGGFIDTLMSKIDDAPNIRYKETTEADLKKALKIQAAWQVDSGSTRGKWGRKDRQVKKLAIFSGRGIYKYYATSAPYKSNLIPIDYYDFVCEPQGGADLDDHLYHGAINFIRTKKELIDGGNSELYDAKQIKALINNESGEADRKSMDEVENKRNRFQALGLDPETANYVGQTIYNLTEWIMKYDGEQYYLFFEAKTGIWIRAEKLKDVFTLNKTPYKSFATHEDAFNFWSKGPCDDLYPVCVAVHTAYNQAFEANQKSIWNQRGFDPKMVPDPSQLEYRPDGLVAIKTSPGRPIQDHIYEFKAPPIGESLNLIQWTINNLGVDTGITASVRGEAEQQRVGIHYSELQQVADRLGTLNKAYSDAWDDLGEAYQYGLRDHVTEDFLVEMIGEQGVEWEAVTKEDAIPNFDISTSSGAAESKVDEVKKQAKAMSLADLGVVATINPKWRTENIMRNAGWSDEEIRIAMDTNTEGDRIIISEAAEENEQMLKEDAKPNRGATTAHLQKHIHFIQDMELEEPVRARIMAHFTAEVPIARENMIRKAQGVIRETPLVEGASPTAPAEAGGMPAPSISGSAAGVARRSQQISNALMPNK